MEARAAARREANQSVVKDPEDAMAFVDMGKQLAVTLLQRSLERGRLGHAYLFVGNQLAELETAARTLSKTLVCQAPPRQEPKGLPLDCCEACLACRKANGDLHPDVQWVRPESKSRVITVEQVRELLGLVHLRPAEAAYKVAVLVAADRLNVQAANAFLKTLEEPPAKSVLVLLTTDPQRLIETVLSRCLRLNFGGGLEAPRTEEHLAWLGRFGEAGGGDAKRGLLGRYELLAVLANELGRRREAVEERLAAASPLERYEDAGAELQTKWEEELKAAIEAEYRRQRSEVLAGVQWWLRDVWWLSQGLAEDRLTYRELAASTRAVAGRISAAEARANLEIIEQTQRLLYSNVQEALALEVGLLKLKL